MKMLRKSSILKILSDSHHKLSSLTANLDVRKDGRTQAWQVHSYGDPSELQYDRIRIPDLQDPNELLINVEAASVNPIDNLMLAGYGRTFLKIPRSCEMELPLILGRDFAGTVVHKGAGVGSDFNVGDRVYGFIPLHKSGSFSNVVVADKDHICHKPTHLSPTEATSIVYAAMTAWASLFITGNLLFKNLQGKKVMILGASGGVGTLAVQLLKSQGCQVFGTCSTDAVPLVQSLGADIVIDYKATDYLDSVAKQGFYDVILDCAKTDFGKIPNNWNYGTYIMLNSPLLINTDKFGLAGGMLQSGSALLNQNFMLVGKGKCVKWGFFVPSVNGFQFINRLVHEKKINPVLHKEFLFENLPDALTEVTNGHLRGKVVVNYGNFS